MTLLHEHNPQGTTEEIVTHDPAESAFGRRLLRLRDGKIVSDGPLQEAALES